MINSSPVFRNDSSEQFLTQRLCELQAISPQKPVVLGRFDRLENGRYCVVLRARLEGGNVTAVSTDSDARVAINRAAEVMKSQLIRRTSAPTALAA